MPEPANPVSDLIRKTPRGSAGLNLEQQPSPITAQVGIPDQRGLNPERQPIPPSAQVGIPKCTGFNPERQRTPIPGQLAIPEHCKTPMPAPICVRLPSTLAVAGPGPATQVYCTAVVAGAVGPPDEVPTRERSHSDRGQGRQATSVEGLRKQDIEMGDPRLDDLDANKEDEDSVMGPTDSVLAKALAGVDEDDEERIDGGDEDEEKPAEDSRTVM